MSGLVGNSRKHVLSCHGSIVTSMYGLCRIMCTPWRLRSVCTTAQSDQSSLSVWRNYGSLATQRVHSEDCGDAKTDLSLSWEHMPFCRLSHALAQMTTPKRAWLLLFLFFLLFETVSIHLKGKHFICETDIKIWDSYLKETSLCKNDSSIPLLIIYSKMQEWLGIVQRTIMNFNRYQY